MYILIMFVVVATALTYLFCWRSERTESSTHQSDESLDSGPPDKPTEEIPLAASTPPTPLQQSPQNNTAKGFLLRLFESKLFDMSMAITYLFNSKEPGVQSYIGNSCNVCSFFMHGITIL